MSPFGFTGESSDDAEKNEFEGSVNFAAMMQQMQKQIQQQFSKLGMSGPGFAQSDEQLPKDIIRESAKKFVTIKGLTPLGLNDAAKIEEAFIISELWLNDATFFPQSTVAANQALTRSDWIDATLSGWQSSVEPLASGLTKALSKLLQDSVDGNEQAQVEGAMQIPTGMIAMLLRSFVGSLIATQLGQSIGGLAGTVTGIHDVGLPLVEPVYPGLIPQNINEWAAGLDIPIDEVRIFHALRESASARLFAHNPWLISYIRTSISDYAQAIHIDIGAIQQQAQDLFDASVSGSSQIDLTSPESFTIALNQGIFTPEETPAQREALVKLETVLALVDGWSEVVVSLAASDRLPNIAALQEVLRRSHVTSAPTQQFFSTLFGLQISPRLAREAASFWRTIGEIGDLQFRDRIWSGILPTSADLLDARSYLSSIEIPDDLSSL